MILTQGCETCCAGDQPGNGGLPGMVFRTYQKWDHVNVDHVSPEALSRVRPCDRPEKHDSKCRMIPGMTYEVVTPCRCNPDFEHPDYRAARKHGDELLEREAKARRDTHRAAVERADVDDLLPSKITPEEVDHPSLPYKD